MESVIIKLGQFNVKMKFSVQSCFFDFQCNNKK